MTKGFTPFPEHVTRRFETAAQTKASHDGPSQAVAAMERKKQRFATMAQQGNPTIDFVGSSSMDIQARAEPPSQPQPHTPALQPGQVLVDKNAPLGPQLAAALAAQGIVPQGEQPAVTQQPIRNLNTQPTAVNRMTAGAVNQTLEEKGIPVPPPSFSGPVSDGEGISVGLPSRFAFYDFADLYVRSPRGRHLSKISKAHDEGSLQILAEVIADLTYTSQGNLTPFLGVDGKYRDTPPAFLLTIQDFYFLLFFIRQNYYTKSQYIHTTHCRNPVHIKAVELGKASLESLTIQEVVNKSNLKVTELESIPEQRTVGDGQWVLGPCRIVDTLDFMEHPKANDAEFEYAAQLASYMRHVSGVYTSIADRVEVYNDLSVSDVEILKEWEKQISHYGVSETINVRCKECGASREAELSLDAHAFLAFN